MSEVKYQDWQGSRWEYTRRRSNWHFDTMRPPEIGADSYTPVCRFLGDFTEAVEICKTKTHASSWATRNSYRVDNLYCANEEAADLVRAGADPDATVFERAVADDIPIFQHIVEHLGMTDNSIKFHNQRTGQMLHTHMDNFAGREERNNSFLETDMDQHPELVRRFVIMLDDWHLGQIFQIGNANWTQWRAGDCITWEWQDMPHSTANMGWWDRPMLQITGRVTDRTKALLSRANKNLEFIM